MSKIEWTEKTWNPVVGCTRVSAGCDNCYAAAMTNRLSAMGQTEYDGLTVLNGAGDRHFNGVVRCLEERLQIPIKRRKPTMYFVNSMSDLFHAKVPPSFLEKVLDVIEATPQHTYQVLTKRPEKMANLMTAYSKTLANLWLGTSIEDQTTANERIPHLLRCPAAVRFLSVEPMLGDIRIALSQLCECPRTGEVHLRCEHEERETWKPAIQWLIVGGESGPGARPCDVRWIRSIVAQCKAAGVPCFVKQLGSAPFSAEDRITYKGCAIKSPQGFSRYLNHRKGGDWNEWPEDLRVRQYP